MKSLLILLFSLSTLLAGNGLTTAFEFLRTDFNPRTAAMGNAFTTLRGDVNGLTINPAGLAYSEQKHVVFNYMNYLLDINGGFAAYSQEFEGIGILSAGINYLDYGTFKETDDFANETGNTFSASDFALILGWADRFEERFNYGVNVKYIYSNIESYNASAIAVDFGLIYEIPFQENLFLGVSLLNIGQNIEYYTSVRESLPTNLRIGFSKILAHLPLEIGFNFTDVNVTADSFSDRIKRFSIGGEFRLSDALRVRLGYNNRLRSDLDDDRLQETGFTGMSGGLGIYVKNFRIDYAMSDFGLLGTTHRFGFSMNIE